MRIFTRIWVVLAALPGLGSAQDVPLEGPRVLSTPQDESTETGSTGIGSTETGPTKGEVARIVDEYLSARAAAEPNPFEKLSLYGDLRLRQEETFSVAGLPNRHRSRLRLRVGAAYSPLDAVEVGARMVTGSRSDPRSPHVTLGDGLEGLEISLDRAYITWRPQAPSALWPEAWGSAGKISHPMRRNPVYGELVWDADIQPEGVVVGGRLGVGAQSRELTWSLGQFLLLEQSLAQDASCSFGQLSVTQPLSSNARARMSAAMTWLHDPAPGGTSFFSDRDRGNTLVAGAFAEDFGVLDVIGDVDFPVADRPLVVSAEWIDNVRADEPARGWALGAAWGRAAQAGDWRAYYQYQDVESDAVFSVLAQDDFLSATGFRGHVLGGNHQLARGVGLHLWGLISEASTGDGGADWRVRIDLNVKF